ncbi:MAG: AAA family ATPase [Nitriliruptor sp.]|uniref:AAA family ATPase n=1 Tax=Nitriliruptor sp. TaxID=2448056 RepID=UPI0034A0209D
MSDSDQGAPDEPSASAGPLDAPVGSMTAAALAAGGAAEVTETEVRDEAALVASWLLGVSGSISPEGVEALRAIVGPVAPAEVARPDLSLVAPDAVLSRLLAGRAHLDAWRYYLAVMELAHAVVALDVYPTASALALLDVLRTTMLSTIDAAGARPGRVPGDPAPASDAVQAEKEPTGAEDRPTEEDVEELLAELDELIGLEPVKAEVRRVADRLLVDNLRTDAGLKVPDVSRHLVFTGNPGTGKTTVARLLGRLYAAMGLVERGHLVETDREGLVAGYVGQTATRVKERFEEADGGVLLVDEAYSLARGGERDFGREAIDAVVKLAEDRRDRIVVILTGYPVEMADLVASNPGMASRFPRTLHFPDYSDEELLEIAELLAEAGAYRLTAGARNALCARFDEAERDRGFGNGRFARNLVEASIDRQASRIAASVREGRSPDASALSQIRAEDVPTADEVAELGGRPADGADAHP